MQQLLWEPAFSTNKPSNYSKAASEMLVAPQIFSPTFIHFHPLSSIVDHQGAPGGRPWYVLDHHRMVLNAQTYKQMDEIGSLNASLRLLKSTTLRCYNLPTPTIQPTISIQPSNSIQSNPIILNTPQQSIMGSLLIPKTKRPLTPGTCVGPSNFKCSKNGFKKKTLNQPANLSPTIGKGSMFGPLHPRTSSLIQFGLLLHFVLKGVRQLMSSEFWFRQTF